ncbi:MAG: hypothetical protein GY810_04550 [Aureispira sp.]|nr:hypothetical protein [Aureispira sp.]
MKNYYLYIISFIFSLFTSFDIQCQELNSVQYGIYSPLQTNTIYEIFGAKNGLLYIATNNGFYSYNGLSFKEYTTQSGTSAFGSNIQEDKGGVIYMKQFDGQVFNLVNDTLQIVEIPTLVKGKLERFRIHQDTFVYFSRESIVIENKATKYIQNVLPKGIEVLGKHGVVNGGIIGWDSTTSDTYGLYYFTLDTFKCLKIKERKQYRNNLIQFIYALDNSWVDYTPQAHNGWIINDRDSVLIDLSLCTQKLTPTRIKKIQQKLWVLCKEGVYLPEQNALYFKGLFITEVVEDQEGNIWVATLEQGLFKISNLNNKFYPKKDENAPVNYVFKVHDHLVYGDFKGNLYQFIREQKEFEQFHTAKRKGNIKNIIYNPVSQQYIVSGNDEVGFDLNWNEQYVLQAYGALYFDESSSTAYKSYLKRVFIIDQRNGYKLSKEKNREYKTQRYDEGFKIQKGGKNGSRSLDILFEEGTVLVKKWRNYIINILNDSLLYINDGNFEVSHKVPLVGAKSIYIEDDRLFIVAKDVIVEYDDKAQVIGQINRDKKLHNRITNLSVDSQYICMSTKSAIHLYNAQNFEYQHTFTSKNGIVSPDFTKGWLYEGNLYANGSNGVSEIVLDESFNKGKPQLRVANVLVNKNKVEGNAFAYDHNNVQVQYLITSYTTTGNLFWRLNDREWNEKEGKPIISLNELQSGNYKIEAYFENDLGTKTPVVIYEFTIHHPFWQTWIGYMLINIGLVGIAILFWRLYIGRKRRKEKQQNQFNFLKLQALQSQMNPHFIFNVQAAIQGLWLEEKAEAALELQTHFSKLLRLIFQYSGKQFISVDELIVFLKHYLELEKIRFEDTIDIVWNIDPVFHQDDYFIPPLLIQPILENAFKHGFLHKKGSKKLLIKFEQKGSYFYCLIEDNGVGRQPKSINKKDEASGLQTTQKRIKLLQETLVGENPSKPSMLITDLKNAQDQPLGTRVEMWIPFTSFQKEIN